MKKNPELKNKGFTIVEVMVAMVILAIGLLGMAGMTLMVIKGNTDASRMTYATNLASDKMESLKDVNWDDLGTATTCAASDATAMTNGCGSHAILGEDGDIYKLNQQGQIVGDTGAQGPFLFHRYWVICHEDGTVTDTVEVSPGDYCSTMGASNRPEELTCNDGVTEVNQNEKKIKIVVSWRDRSGRCHKVDMSSIQVKL